MIWDVESISAWRNPAEPLQRNSLISSGEMQFRRFECAGKCFAPELDVRIGKFCFGNRLCDTIENLTHSNMRVDVRGLGHARGG